MAAVCLDGAWDRWPSLVMCLEMVTMGDEGGQRAWSTALVDGRLSKQTPSVSFSHGWSRQSGWCMRTVGRQVEDVAARLGWADGQTMGLGGGAVMACTVETMPHASCPILTGVRSRH